MIKERGEFINFKKEVQHNNSSHLKAGVRSIRACIGKPEEFDHTKPRLDKQILEIISWKVFSQNVNYEGDSNFFKRNFKHDDKYSYLISRINDKWKFTETLKNCTGMVVAGQEEKTGKEISFLSHQNTDHILEKTDNYNKNTFKGDLASSLNEINERSIDRTVDAVIFGGYYLDYSTEIKKNYIKLIKILKKEVQKNLGFEPLVIKGPKNSTGEDNVYYKTDKRELRIVTYHTGVASTESYYPSKINEQKKKW